MKRRCNGAARRFQRWCGLGWTHAASAAFALPLLLLTAALMLGACARSYSPAQPIITAPAQPAPVVKVAVCPPLTAARPASSYTQLPASADWEAHLRAALADLSAWAAYALLLEPAARCGATK